MTTWDSQQAPPSTDLRPAETRRALLRLFILALGLVPGLASLAIARAVDVIAFAGARRASPRVVQAYARFALRVMGLALRVKGRPMAGHGALVANHASWLDIFVLSAATPVIFVAKAEVGGWPGIGALARWAGTVFVRRDRRDAQAQTKVMARAFRQGERLLFFPEGTSTDGTLVLPFKPTLFQALLSGGMPTDMAVQPVTLRYTAPAGADPRFYGWWGGMAFASHFMRVLGQAPQGHVTLVFHAACACKGSRKSLAQACEAAVRQGFAAEG